MTSPPIVETVDVVKHIGLRYCACRIVSASDPLPLDPDRMLVAAPVDTAVSHFDSLAKYLAAALKGSRSSLTLTSSRSRRGSSSSRLLPWPGKACSSPYSLTASRQRRSCRLLIPSSSHARASVTPGFVGPPQRLPLERPAMPLPSRHDAPTRALARLVRWPDKLGPDQSANSRYRTRTDQTRQSRGISKVGENAMGMTNLLLTWA